MLYILDTRFSVGLVEVKYEFYYIIVMLQMDLTLYDPEQSTTSNMVGCDSDFCTSTYDGPISGCTKDMSCPYSITYGDGSTTSGSYVKDHLTFDRANGDLSTVPDNSTTVIFGWVQFIVLLIWHMHN